MKRLSGLEYVEDENGDSIDNPKQACDYPDEYFIDGATLQDVGVETGSTDEIEVPEVVDTLCTFLLAVSQASDEDLLALREYVRDVLVIE
jgi:hypothetical protein